MIVLAREDVEVHLHALQTMNEEFYLCEWRNCHLGKRYLAEIRPGSRAAPDYPTSPRSPLQ
jgi:hypothetical protein